MASKMDNPFPEMIRSREKAKELCNAAEPGDDRAVFENPGLVKSEGPLCNPAEKVC